MSFASWKQGITIEKHVISKDGLVSDTDNILFQKPLKGLILLTLVP